MKIAQVNQKQMETMISVIANNSRGRSVGHTCPTKSKCSIYSFITQDNIFLALWERGFVGWAYLPNNSKYSNRSLITQG